jgi:23S rRNA pseudouridine1911/1915/1917 synthase
VTHDFQASSDDINQRLDRVVATHCPDLSRTRVQELIDSANILVDGKPAKVSYKLRGGEHITVTAEPRPPIRAEAESIPLDTIYEDDDVLAINKPAGMIVHAGAGNHSGTLVNALLGRGQSLSQGGDILRPGIVHRLDKETSGIILVAKNDLAHAKLGEAFRSRKVKKTYIALVEGHLDHATGIIDLAIARDPKRRIRMTTRRSLIISGAREARTEWRALARIGPATLLEVQLHTGRTHQIRVHFSALQHPVVGDTLYGASEQLTVNKLELPPLHANRNFLHAAKLGFAQPTTGVWIDLKAPLPAALVSYLHQLTAASNDSQQRIDAALATYL